MKCEKLLEKWKEVEKEEYFLSEIFKYLKLVKKSKVKSSWYAESFNELHGGKFKKILKLFETCVRKKTIKICQFLLNLTSGCPRGLHNLCLMSGRMWELFVKFIKPHSLVLPISSSLPDVKYESMIKQRRSFCSCVD